MTHSPFVVHWIGIHWSQLAQRGFCANHEHVHVLHHFSFYFTSWTSSNIALQRIHLRFLWCGCTEVDLIILQLLYSYLRADPEKLPLSIEKQNKPPKSKNVKTYIIWLMFPRGVWTSRRVKGLLIYWKSGLLRQMQPTTFMWWVWSVSVPLPACWCPLLEYWMQDWAKWKRFKR